jgi:hypothetical protein
MITSPLARRGTALTALATCGIRACAARSGQATETGAKSMAQQASPATASDLIEAIAIAERNFDQANANVSDYLLVQAQRLLAGGEPCAGTRCWRLTFKLTRLIPTSLPALIGAGGELFFSVDLERGAARLTGYGE